MKTLQELYTEIMGSDELKKTFAQAAKDGKFAEFLEANGCEATREEIKAFLSEKTGQQLSDEELESAAGGKCNKRTQTETICSIITAGLYCAGMAVSSAIAGHTGQKTDNECRLCNFIDR